MTIAIHLAGAFSLLTATDTQETYSSGEKVDSGKIISAGRGNPIGSISIAGAGDSEYIEALSQELSKTFQAFRGSFEELEAKVRETAKGFYSEHVLPFVGKFDDDNVPDYSLLIAASHEGKDVLWNVERTMLTDAALYDCIGSGKPAADSLLNRLYPIYPTLDSLAVLAAYVIYRVKSTVDGCGLKTEIRFIQRDKFAIGLVPPATIDRWETQFKKYDRLEREILYHAMNFIERPPAPPPAIQKTMPNYNHEQTFRAQMRPMQEIVKEIEAMRAEFANLTIAPPV